MQEITESTEREVHLKDYWMVVQKRLWMVVTFLIITVSVVYLQVSKQEPLYRASARLQIDREAPRVLNFQEVVSTERGYWGDEYYQTQYALLQSRALALEVVNTLDLSAHPDFQPRSGQQSFFQPRKWLKSSLSWAKSLVEKGEGEKKGFDPVVKRPPDVMEEKENTGMINAFLGRLEISPVENTRLVDIKTVSGDPELAAMMANTLADAFIARSQSLKLSTTRDATDWLSAEMKEARKNLETSELALQRYKEANDIVSLENRQNMAVLKLEELNTVLTEAKTSRIAFETRYQQMQKVITDGELVDTLPEVIENSFVQELKGEYSRLQNELSDLSKTYTPKHPKIIRLKSQMESIQKQLDGEVEKVIASIENEYQVALAKEKSLQKAVDQQKQEVQALNQRSIKYGALEREVENNRRIFNTLLGRAKETGLAEGLQTGNIHIVDRAEIPLAPFSPSKRRSLMLAIMVGLLGGVGLTFFFDYLDDSIKDPDDLEEHAQLPLLASVPVIKTRRGKGPKELVADKDTKSFYAEAYRSARTSIIFSSPDSQPETILVTSPGPQDGKTLTAVNLAITMAHAGNRVLLMDGDLRRPRIHSVFGLTNDFGLTNLLTESTDIKLSLRNTDILNLAVMTSGPIPPNPSELFVSKRMGVLLETLMKRFDRIIIDSPPTISVTDANILAAVTDGVVLVIKAGKTSRRIVNRAKKNLEEVQGKLLGVILNAVDMRRSRYYYVPSYYYKYYGKHRERKRKAG